MAKKKSPTLNRAAPAPSVARITAALDSGNFVAALEVARQLHTLAPTPEHLTARKHALVSAARYYAEHNRHTEFNHVMREAETLTPDDVAWQAERAVLLVHGGRLADALTLHDQNPDPTLLAKILGHAADHAIRLRSPDALPENLRPAYQTVLTAFQKHEEGNETAAREAMEPIGLRSPFLEWKLLLRGLLAHAANDDARAIDNFSRLDPTRLPHRLAAPIRFGIDPAFKASLPAGTAAIVQKQHENLGSGPIVEGLRAIARELGRNKSLTPAFRAAERLLPLFKNTSPHLIPRLANCIYHALLTQGQPEDLPKYRRLFGSPPGDPQFHKLLGQVSELIEDPNNAHTNWRKYEEWLATKPAGWPAAVLTRARAVIWLRIGDNARAALEADSRNTRDLFSPRRRSKPKPLDPPAEACYHRAAELAPDWPPPHRKLFDSLVASRRFPEAEAAAREFLAHHPDDLPILKALASTLQSNNRPAEAAEFWGRALATNPLDKPIRFKTATATLAAARASLIAGKPAEAETRLDHSAALLEEQVLARLFALRSVIRVKLGHLEEAAAFRTQALAVPGDRLGAAYRMMIDSLQAKLKPADKRAIDKIFAEEMAKPATPMEVIQLIAVYDGYFIDGITYRGQKTHDKKVLDMVGKCLAVNAPEMNFERLGELLVAKQQWKHTAQLADRCRSKFPRNPLFPLLRAECGLARDEREYTLNRLLVEARRLAEESSEPRHRALLERIDALQKRTAFSLDFLDHFFGDGS